LLVGAMRRYGLGGAALAIVREGERPELECVGVADRKTNRAVDPDTVFRIASISKTMTAIGVMQLRDRGLLDLDEPVNKYLTAFTVEPPSGGEPVTARHLLTHTAGIGEAPRVPDFVRKEVWGMGPPRTAAANLSALYGGTLRPETAAGAKWAYANHGFAVLQQLVEDVSGQSFGPYMHEHLFAPLGMNSTEYTRTDRTADQLATGSHWVLGRLGDVKDYDLAILGPGSVLSSVADMATYAEWLLHGGAATHGDALRPATLAEMMSPQYSVDPRLAGMGLAFFLDHLGEHRVAGHDGNNVGFASALLTAPDDGVAVVVLTNTATFMGAQLLARTTLRSLLGVSDPATELLSTDVAERPHSWSELVGHYAPRSGFLTNFRSWQTTGGEVQIVVRHRRLVIRALSPLRQLRKGRELYPTDDADPLLFAFEVEGLVVHVAFARDATDQVERVSIGAPANAVFHRRSALRSSRLRLRLAAGLAAIAVTRRGAFRVGRAARAARSEGGRRTGRSAPR
jgi:CubicO group peptidase (beta-lactamase class C family)